MLQESILSVDESARLDSKYGRKDHKKGSSMTIHEGNIEQSEPPVGWTFEIGTFVSHKDQSLPSLVMDRVRTSKGREVYGIRSFAYVDPARDRLILGDFLELMDDDHLAWDGCLLAGTPLDPRGSKPE